MEMSAQDGILEMVYGPAEARDNQRLLPVRQTTQGFQLPASLLDKKKIALVNCSKRIYKKPIHKILDSPSHRYLAELHEGSFGYPPTSPATSFPVSFLIVYEFGSCLDLISSYEFSVS